MSKVIFTVKYELKPDAEDEYLKIAKELKAIVKAEGLLDYEIYKLHDKLAYCEIFVFENKEAYENYDDSEEMLTLLLGKLSDLIVEGSMKYSTYEKLLDE